MENTDSTGELSDSPINRLAEDIFHLTLNKNSPALNKEETSHLVYCSDLSSSILLNKVFDLENFKIVLFERLVLVDPFDYVVKSKTNNFVRVDSHTVETRCVIYLFECYKRISLCRGDEELLQQVRDIIIENAATALRLPFLFEPQEIHEQILSLFTTDDGRGDVLRTFIAKISECIVEDVGFDSLSEAFLPLLQMVHNKFNSTVIIALPRPLFDFLQTLSVIPFLAQVLVNYIQAKRPQQALSYADSLLGSILNISCLPKTADGPYEYFDNIYLMGSSIKAEESRLWYGLAELGDRTHALIESLLRVDGGRHRPTLLRWLGDSLEHNLPRAKLWATLTSISLLPTGVGYISDAFCINLLSLLLRLCRPFTTASQGWSRLLKIDPTYSALPDIVCPSLRDEACLQPKEDGETRLVSSGQQSFMTQIFFMTHRAIDLGLRVLEEKIVQLNQDLMRVEGIDARMRSYLEPQMSRLFCMRCAVMEPIFLSLLGQFQVANAVWLVQVILNTEDEPGKETYAPLKERPLKFPLPENGPATLKCVPQLILEQVETYIRLLKMLSSQPLEEGGPELLNPILTLLIVTMGSKGRTRNPHLRARMAKCIEALLPTEENNVSFTNNMAVSSINRTALFIHHPYAHQLVESLLNVFVSIEMTGEGVEFEQKFNYRQPMYIIMDYLWKTDVHSKCFIRLAHDAERNMEEVNPPLFLRFLNLLMNDAIFLLDEALANMAKLRTMHNSREAGEWNNLPPDEIRRNEQHLRFTGMTARFDNILGRETIHTLEYLSSKVKTLMCHPTMVDRMASMLNYFLYHLVGPMKKNFKVKDMSDYEFEPGIIVKDICSIYVHLGSSNEFCSAISRDKRSYSPQLFSFATDVLARIGGSDLLGDMMSIGEKVASLSERLDKEDELMSDVPDEFLDPIMSTIMNDPVILPSSNITIDRATIARHLLSDQSDPFNRSPLTMNMVIPNEELKVKIQEWINEKHKSQTN